MLEKPRDDIDSVYYEDLDNYDDDDDDNNINYYDYVYRKIGSVRRLFKKFDIDYYKPILNDSGLDGIINSYMEYTSNGDRYENLLPEEYLNLMRPYLTDLINKHITTMELNNNNNSDNNNNNNNNNDNNNNNTDRGEWKIQLTMINSCISTKSFKDKHTIYLKSEQVEIYMGSDTENVIDTLFNTLLQNFQCAQETSNERRSEFIPDSVEILEYEFHKIGIIRAESYIITPDWIASKKATINPKNEKDNKCFQWSIIAGLNYNKIKEKELKKLLKFRRVDTDFSSYQRDWEEFEQSNASIALNILFLSHNSEEVKLAYKSSYNMRKNQVILLMINDESNNSIILL